MIGYCPSAGRIPPRHLLSFSTDSTAIAQVASALSHNARIVPPPLSRSPDRSLPPLFFSLSVLSRTFSSILFTATRATSTRLVPFVLGSMPQLTSRGREEKKIGRETVSTREGRATARSDRFIAATADGRLRMPRFFSSLFAPDRALQT